MKAKKKELGDWQKKRKQRQRSKMQCEVHGKIDKFERAENDHILAFSEVLETTLTSWNSFNVHFAILFPPCCTWLIASKPHTTPTNSNVHVSSVGSKVIEMCTRHKICTSSIGTIWLVIVARVIVARDLFLRFSQVKSHSPKLKQQKFCHSCAKRTNRASIPGLYLELAI